MHFFIYHQAIIKHRILQQRNCFKFANVMNNITIINPFTSHNKNISNIKIQHCQIMTTITNIILEFKSMIKKPIVPNHAFFTFITFGRMRLNILLVARCLLLSAHCSLLFTGCSLLSAQKRVQSLSR